MPKLSYLSRLSLFLLLFCCFMFPALVHAAASRDSIRTETYKNHQVIIYRVSSKETIYSISRKYNIAPKEVIALNEGHQSLRVGDEIRIPLKESRVNATSGSLSASGAKSGSSKTPAEQSYTVQRKETFYSIARKFGMKPQELESINALKSTVLSPGQLLTVIPYKNPETTENNSQAPAPEKAAPAPAPVPADTDHKTEPAEKKPLIPATGLYIVQPGETVFAISIRYGIPVARIQELNHLNNNGIHAGQTLKLSSGAAEPGTKANADSSDDAAAAPVKTRPALQKPVVPVDTPKPAGKQPEVILPGTDQSAPAAGHVSKEFKEEGVGLWLNNNDLNQARSVALHRTAPVGTIIKVTNPMSRKSIFVKVVGSFPQTADSKDAVIVISKSAAELIGALDQRFRVELSYAW